MKISSIFKTGLLKAAVASALALPLAVSCFDPSGLQEQIDMLVDKVYELETKLNNEIAALQAMLKTAEAVRCLGINLYGSELKKMFDAPMNSVYADLSMVTHNDGWTGATLTSYARYYNLA